MKITPKTKVMTATALTNPDPSFVSLVKAGANKRPFRAVKMDAAVAVSSKEDGSMKTTKATGTPSVAPNGFGVFQFEFSKEKFDSVDAVKAWMDAGGYTDYEVTETAKSFEITDSETKFAVGTVARIDDIAEGVGVFVGKLAVEDSADDASGEPAAEADTTDVAKIDDTPQPDVENAPAPEPEALEPEASDPPAPAPEPAIEPDAGAGGEADAGAGDPPAVTEGGEGGDAVQPGADTKGGDGGEGGEPAADQTLTEKADAFVLSLKEAPVMARRGIGCYGLYSLIEVVASLKYLIQDADYNDFSSDTVASLKTAATAALAALMAGLDQFGTEYADVLKAAPVEIERNDGGSAFAELAVAPPADFAAAVAKAVAEAVAPLQKQLVVAEREAGEAKAAKKVAEDALAERVEADNNRSQTRKGADSQTDATGNSKPADNGVKRCDTSMNLLSAMGSRHARP